MLLLLALSVLPLDSRAADGCLCVQDDNTQLRVDRDAASRIEAATVLVLGFSPQGLEVMGSGFLVSAGAVLTSAHVVWDLNLTYFILNRELPLTEVSVAAITYGGQSDDDGRDFALLRFSMPANTLVMPLVFITDYQRMDRVHAWGYPAMVTKYDKSMREPELTHGGASFSAPPIVYTEGSISAVVEMQGGRCIIHSAQIANGSSGGPLVNERGEVIGMNTWGFKETDEGAFINAALPSALILDFLLENGVRPLHVGERGDSPVDSGQKRKGIQ